MTAMIRTTYISTRVGNAWMHSKRADSPHKQGLVWCLNSISLAKSIDNVSDTVEKRFALK